MTPIYFFNPTDFDPRTFLFLGVSVKRGGSIGRFGTGLKYAIAWLLRNQHEVLINSTPITTRQEEVRGKLFDLVYFGDQPAGFTTDLGPDWEGWMAFRELYANALDEGGEVGLSRPNSTTVVEVRCPPDSTFLAAFKERDRIIVPRTEWTFESNLIGTSTNNALRGHFYVRGVRAGKMAVPSILAWNHTDPNNDMLSEERLIKSPITFRWNAESVVAMSNNPNLIRTVVLAPRGTWESEFKFDFTEPSQTFTEVVWELRSNPALNQTALERVREVGGKQGTGYTPIQADEWMLAAACKIASKVQPILPNEIQVTADFGYPTLGLYHPRTGEIWLSRDAFRRGMHDLVATVLEEAIHKHRGLEDKSRAMQEYLFGLVVEYLMKEEEK